MVLDRVTVDKCHTVIICLNLLLGSETVTISSVDSNFSSLLTTLGKNFRKKALNYKLRVSKTNGAGLAIVIRVYKG